MLTTTGLAVCNGFPHHYRSALVLLLGKQEIANHPNPGRIIQRARPQNILSTPGLAWTHSTPAAQDTHAAQESRQCTASFPTERPRPLLSGGEFDVRRVALDGRARLW